MSETEQNPFNTPRWRYWGDRTPPKNRADVFSVRAATGDVPAGAAADTTSTTATLRMYGPIDSWGWPWGISAKDVSAALDSLPDDVTEIRVRINSPGGEAWEGMAILNMLRAHRARAVAVVDGIAASAASVIAAGLDETTMSPGTQLMIHDASAFAIGDAATMERAQNMLNSVSDSIASVYAEAAGGSAEDWREAMVAETWYTAAEAVAAGLADRVAVVADEGETETAGDPPEIPDDDEPEDRFAAAVARFDLSLFAHAGRADAPPPPLHGHGGALAPAARAHNGGPSERVVSHKPPAEPADNPTPNPKGAGAMPDTLIQGLRERLGISPETELDDAQALAALDEALAERASDAAAPKFTPPPGTVVLDAAQYEALKAGAEDGARARADQVKARREQLVDAAVSAGQIPAARRDHWLTQLAVDEEGTAPVLASLPKDTIPLEDRGITGGVDESTDDDTVYARVYTKEA